LSNNDHKLPDVVITEFIDEDIALKVLCNFNVHYDPKLVDDQNQLYEMLPKARALIVRNRTQVNEKLLKLSPNLKVVGRLGVGLDNIDLKACKNHKVIVCPATGANDVAVAEYTITAALILMRGAWHASETIIGGGWPRTNLMGHEISGKNMGLIGFGSIAREVAERSKALGMEVFAYDPYLPANDPAWSNVYKADAKFDLAENCDVISIHVPYTNKTHQLVDASFIKKMQPGAILINTARGGIVDENALIKALSEKKLRGAALDVFEDEPLSSEHRNLFKDIPNLILTPHIAGITKEANERVSLLTVQNVVTNLSSKF
jgi:(S)-sulfolactate dehydrogenase